MPGIFFLGEEPCGDRGGQAEVRGGDWPQKNASADPRARPHRLPLLSINTPQNNQRLPQRQAGLSKTALLLSCGPK